MKYKRFPVGCSILFFVVVGMLASCTPDVPNVPAQPIYLVSTPDTILLSKPALTGTSSMALTCGCGFLFTVTAYSDTSNITFQIPPDNSQTGNYTIIATAKSGLPNGSYNAWVSFKTFDASNNAERYDTLHAILNIP